MNFTAQTRRFTPAGPKPFAWSYSKLKNFETCPKRHWHIDLAKDVVEAESQELKWGDQVHKAMAARIGKGTPLPMAMQDYEPWVERFFTFKGNDVRRLPNLQVLVEQKWGLTKDFAACEFFDRNVHVWYRAIGDAVWIAGPVGVVYDWKTGKIVEDSVQLMLTCAVMFAHFPELQVVRSVFAWLKEDAETPLDVTRAEVPKLWGNLWSRIETLREAHETTTYPATPNSLCRRWCPVKQCPHNGGG